MNDAGLAVSLAVGGRIVHGPGFAMLLVLRYLLETCRTFDETVGGLRTLPVAIPQNVTLVPEAGVVAGP
ncbi:carcinine hydrolase/isopenicillin-N N-acyltransferase family protein [Streptomyces olivaceus]|uniref:carcinine hydrolase/isopenicillin-N N-acyltransferase family protein n=1 Tax=Streptomyces olivaceus TaxID=47716 RepID=UPI0040579ED2